MRRENTEFESRAGVSLNICLFTLKSFPSVCFFPPTLVKFPSSCACVFHRAGLLSHRPPLAPHPLRGLGLTKDKSDVKGEKGKMEGGER